MVKALITLVTILTLGTLYLESSPPNAADLEQSIVHGLKYLDTKRDPTSVFDEAYLHFRYPNETLPGYQTGMFPVTYRVIDILTALVFLSETRADLGPIADLAARAKRELAVLPPLWRDAVISYETKSEKADKAHIALDTYCIVGLLHKDKVMADNVRRNLKEGRWIPPKMFGGIELWRNVADESWCTLFLIEMGDSGPALEAAVEMRLRDMGELRKTRPDSTQGHQAETGAAIHIAMIGQALRDKNRLSQSWQARFAADETQLVDALTDYTVRNSPSLLGNVLDVLLKSSDPIARRKAKESLRWLISLQRPSGVFAKPDRAEGSPAFGTVRILTALSRAQSTSD